LTPRCTQGVQVEENLPLIGSKLGTDQVRRKKLSQEIQEQMKRSLMVQI
jgi:hypothetical protein